MPKLIEINEQLAAKRKRLQDIFAEAGEDMDFAKVSSLEGDTAAKVAEVQRMNQELEALGATQKELQELDAIARKNADEYGRLNDPAHGFRFPIGKGRDDEPKPFNLRQMIAESKDYQAFRAGNVKTAAIDLGIDLKTLVTLSTANVQNDRRDLVNMALEERTVADLMLQSGTDGNTLEYYEETTFTNNAAETSEAGTYPESAVAYTLRTESVRKIDHFIPMTRESMDDVSWLEGQIRGRLVFGVKRREETQLLTGNGSAPNLQGILNRSGIQTQALGTDPVPDAIFKAMQKVRGAAGSGFAEPTAIVLHPNDWTDVRLLRTADGIYIWGSPADPGPERMWGLEVRQTTAETQNTGLVGAFRPYAEIVRRSGVTVELSTEHSTYFIEGKVALAAWERLALMVTRPSAFCTVTGI